jgi:catechol 2,3-dioxygenase-like lactoylglutathione lyase family enzyme
MNFHSTVLFVNDIAVSKVFYTQFLNFTIELDFGKNVVLSNGITLWEIGKDHLITNTLKTENESNRFELYFEDEHIDELFRTLEKAGIRFLHPIHEEPWGQRTLRFFDPDNHLVEIGEPLDVFVNNMHNRGLTPAQISAKSGIPIEKVVGLIWK